MCREVLLTVSQKFREFRSKVKWKGPFRFGSSGIFETPSGGQSFFDRFVALLLSSRFHLGGVGGSGKGKENVKGHFSWLARFDRKFPFYFSLVSGTGICPVCHKHGVLPSHFFKLVAWHVVKTRACLPRFSALNGSWGEQEIWE